MNPQYYVEMASLEGAHWWFDGRRRILAKVLGTLALDAQSSILEAGCGTGGNLALLARYGQLAAFEPDDEARALANRRGIVSVVEGALPAPLPFEDSTFDLIAMLDVLEHIEDDEAALKALRERLKPAGHLLLTVPAYPWLWSRHDETNHHYRRYRRSPLVQLLEAARFTVTYATYFNTLLFPVVAGVRIVNKALGRDRGSDFSLPPASVNRMLASLFAAERHMMPALHLPFGVSLLVVARRDRAVEMEKGLRGEECRSPLQ